jgi:hypothetical protein
MSLPRGTNVLLSPMYSMFTCVHLHIHSQNIPRMWYYRRWHKKRYINRQLPTRQTRHCSSENLNAPLTMKEIFSDVFSIQHPISGTKIRKIHKRVNCRTKCLTWWFTVSVTKKGFLTAAMARKSSHPSAHECFQHYLGLTLQRTISHLQQSLYQ